MLVRYLSSPAPAAALAAAKPLQLGSGAVAPPNKNTLLVLNGLLAKYGMWQARRHGAAGQLQRLAAARAAAGAGEDGQPPPG